MKVEYVKLSQHDLETLIEVTGMIIDYKSRALSQLSWTKFELEYLPKLAEQFNKNSWKVADPHNNTLVWLIDQICHSRRVIEGTRLKDGILLADTPIGARAMEICRTASRGQFSYDTQARVTTYEHLFPG